MDLDDHARYVLDVASQSANITCDPVLITTGNNNWLPIVLFLTSFALFLLGYNTSTIFKKAKRGFRNVFDDFRYPTLRNFRTNGDVEGSQIDSSKRLQSLDVFRG